MDLSLAANQFGMNAAGYQLDLTTLQSSRIPVVVHLKKGDYQHFSVFLGVQSDFYILSDPAQGKVRFSKEQFSGLWTGYVLALWPRGASSVAPVRASDDFPAISDGIRNAFDHQHPFWQGIR